MIKLIYSFNINQYFLSYIINNDSSGIQEKEIIVVDQFLAKNKGNFEIKEQDGFFAKNKGKRGGP